jgi:uncharacterized protein YbjT (DUF2867 family)
MDISNSTIKLILTGATGMVGEGVLTECLQHPEIEQILVINRKPCGVRHPKLKEIIHTNFFDFSSIESELVGYNACFFCLGISSVGVKKEDFYQSTYVLTMHVAETLSKLNSDMIFCYISGAGTDATEKGRMAWARVKGKTENDLMKLPFKRVYNFRPGALEATKGAKNILPYYKYFAWGFPILKIIAPNSICSLKELGIAMTNAVTKGSDKQVIEVKDIHILSKK